MKVGISISLDVTKILKERLYQGNKGTYLDITSFVDLDVADQFGNNGFVSQSMTKEERDNKTPRTPILGNVKVFYNDNTSQEQRSEQYNKGTEQAKEAMAPALDGGFEDSDIPF
tara:strand:- start:215 stop:556 length:342 start_codon:yes stop_codon:yes gene_type:complete